MADYLVETGKGRYIDIDEVMEILQRSEDNGYVHQITNIDGEEKIFAICNCAPGVCNALRTSQLFNTPNMSRSTSRTAWPAADVWNSVRRELLSSARSSALRMARSNIRSVSCLMPRNGDRTSGARITEMPIR